MPLNPIQEALLTLMEEDFECAIGTINAKGEQINLALNPEIFEPAAIVAYFIKPVPEARLGAVRFEMQNLIGYDIPLLVAYCAGVKKTGKVQEICFGTVDFGKGKAEVRRQADDLTGSNEQGIKLPYPQVLLTENADEAIDYVAAIVEIFPEIIPLMNPADLPPSIDPQSQAIQNFLGRIRN